MSEIPQVYGCIAAVSAEMASTGISKGRSNQQQGYRFRGIDDVFNALAPMLVKHGLVILPRILSREVVERQTQKGGTLFYVTVEAEFDFVAAADASRHIVRTFGEAMDSADKATNKAMSAAYKYAALQAFCIPTEGDNDADATTHEPAPQTRRSPAQEPAPAAESHSGAGVTVTGAKVAKRGTSGKGPWALHVVTFSDGREGKTFSTSVYEAAQEAQREGRALDVELNQKGDIVTMVPIYQMRESA